MFDLPHNAAHLCTRMTYTARTHILLISTTAVTAHRDSARGVRFLRASLTRRFIASASSCDVAQIPLCAHSPPTVSAPATLGLVHAALSARLGDALLVMPVCEGSLPR